MKLFIWLDVDEEEDRAACGCTIRNHGGEGPAFYMCNMHLYAERVLKALERMIYFYKPTTHDKRFNMLAQPED